VKKEIDFNGIKNINFSHQNIQNPKISQCREIFCSQFLLICILIKYGSFQVKKNSSDIGQREELVEIID
jgi:hypothetical protein